MSNQEFNNQEHLPVKTYLAAVDTVGDLLRDPHHNPGRTGLPTDMSDLELGLAAYYADDPNSLKPHVAARIAKQQSQAEALETYRPNYIASAESDRDDILNQIDERKMEIKRNTPFFHKIGKGFMNAVSYVPGLDMAVALWREDSRAQHNHTNRNYEAYKRNPNIKLEKENRVFTQSYGGSGGYAAKYEKHLKQQRKHEDKGRVFELESQILEYQEELEKAKRLIKDLRNGKPL